jgi:hypothetical protein
MRKIVIVSENVKSHALKALARKLTERLGYHVYRVTPDRVGRRIAVHFHTGIDKCEQFDRFSKAAIASPVYTLDSSRVNELGSRRIVARKVTNGSQGVGITIFNAGDPVPAAPLYTAYIPKKKEFRVHVWNNKVIDVQEKRKRSGEDVASTEVRNSDSGYVYCRNNVSESVVRDQLAVSAVQSLGRTQGAVDIIWQEKSDKYFVLEVNSRPGMEGTTLDKYADAILEQL